MNDRKFHKGPYLQSKEWLEKNLIYYDELIVNARDKGNVCIENNIDLLVDDNISNCLKVNSLGIAAITIGSKNDKKIKSFDNWQAYN